MAAIAFDSTTADKSVDTAPNIKAEKGLYAVEHNMSIQSASNDTASIFDQEEYQISPVYAELLHNVYRSNWFRVISPADSTLLIKGDNIVYAWETNIKEPIYFEVTQPRILFLICFI